MSELARAWWSMTIALAVVIVAAESLVPGPDGARAAERPEVGAAAPDFVLPNLDGAQVRLSDFRGKKAVFLSFWASWCPSCQEEMPTMEKLYREFKPRGLEILAVSIDHVKADVGKFMRMHGVSFPALLDPGRKVAQQYRVATIPTHYLIEEKEVTGCEHTRVSERVGPRPSAVGWRLP